MAKSPDPVLYPKRRASLTLESIVAYRDEQTDLYYEDICISRMKGKIHSRATSRRGASRSELCGLWDIAAQAIHALVGE